MTPEIHQRVMNRATRLWHERGKPNGHYRELWEEARREVEAEPPEASHVDELSTWMPARPLPRRHPSRLQRLARTTGRKLKQAIHGN